MKDHIVMPLWTCCLFIVVMNTTMFNVSLPIIIHDLQITSDLGSWVISSYSIGYALSTVIYSRLSDRVPVRKLLTVGLLILGLSSLLGLFAHSFAVLLLTRILQSAGAGVMAGLGLVIASRYIPLERRGAAIALISSGSAMAFGLGPIVGGLVSEYWGWNGLFAITVLVLIALPVLLYFLPNETTKTDQPFDTTGAILTTLNAVTLLVAITQQSLLWFAVGILSLVVHILYIRKAKLSFINPQVFKAPGYTRLVMIGFCVLVVNLGNLFLMPLVLADLFARSSLAIGLLIAPGAIVAAFMARYIGRWIDQYGNMRFLIIGHVLLAAVLTLFMLGLNQSAFVITVGYLFFSPAISASMSSLNNEASRILPKSQIGSGMGVLQLVQFFGGSVSVAACGLLLHRIPHVTVEQAYHYVYGCLLIVAIVSLVLVICHHRASRPTSPAFLSNNS
ncbi:DHA2 family metal-tetracycline-proton antiporter-like MFS transporter [Paenibacillus amylolyticus]|uniref:DHA2 family metal-tetracycline-proton antiporter-like MFS transporter n=1 Tax=Paenibacillus amylolyticus TaxID=1451 RepID=A0AAP5GZX2_PAEAM|nr:MFS transporter [Paenibacillus amylolyticus]MDR6723342.1 DHA2 family metal-tetracycline-proton antiporter-like MFS transporter [Paenibacillus amylolyticus]